MEKKITFHQEDRDVMNEKENNFTYFWIFLTLFPIALVLSQLHFLEACSIDNELRIIAIRQEDCFSNEALMRRDPDVESRTVTISSGGNYGNALTSTTTVDDSFPGIS